LCGLVLLCLHVRLLIRLYRAPKKAENQNANQPSDRTR
jgi:hypothetical protein